MPEVRRQTLPYRAGYARARGEAAVRTREMQFKVAFEDVRAQRRLQEIGLQFQAAQKRMEMASAIEQRRQQDKAGAEALGIEAARRGEDVEFKNPYSSLAYAETRRQMKAREQAAIERRKTLEETFEREMEVKGFEKVPETPRVDVQFLRPGEVKRPVDQDIIRVGGKEYRKPPADVGKLMAQVSQAAREFVLREGTPQTPDEFRTRLKSFHKVQWEQEEAKTRAKAMDLAEESFLIIRSDVKSEDGYQAEFDAIEEMLQGIGFTDEEIASVAKIDYKGRNRTVIQWNKLRKMLFQKRLARVGAAAKPAAAAEGSLTEAFLESVEKE